MRGRLAIGTERVVLCERHQALIVARSDIETISLAFHDDPTWSWAFPDPPHRQEQYAAFWGLMIAGALRYPWVLMTEKCEAAAVWIPPYGTELSEEQERPSRADRGRQDLDRDRRAGKVPSSPLRLCEELGVAVGLGCDGIRDLWSPFGIPDLLERAMLLAWRSGFRRDDDLRLALEAATSGGARIMGLDRYGLEPGCVADLVLVPAESPGDALMRRAPRSLVLKRGRIVGGQR